MTKYVRLSTRKPTRRHRYIALSHCWGTTPSLTLIDTSLPLGTGKNCISLQKFRSGLLISKLPRTFRDAVCIARRLNVRYLWIDALCIVQNSQDDWVKESARMHAVYGNAYCTLAATSSLSGDGGLFHDRDPNMVNLIQVHPVWVDPSPRGLTVVPLDFWKVNVSEAPLNRCAWVLQERILSSRVIHFGANQILWDCNSFECCESFPDGFPDLIQCSDTRLKCLDLETDGINFMNRIHHHVSEERAMVSGSLITTPERP